MRVPYVCNSTAKYIALQRFSLYVSLGWVSEPESSCPYVWIPNFIPYPGNLEDGICTEFYLPSIDVYACMYVLWSKWVRLGTQAIM